MRRLVLFVVLIIATTIPYTYKKNTKKDELITIPQVNAQSTSVDWPMAGQNPQRTSWSPHEVKVNPSNLVWSKSLTPYIPARAQVIATTGSDNVGRIFVPTADGVYIFDANDGTQLWQYQTSMPVGNSPTVDGDIMYVPVYDKKLRAVDYITQQEVWAFQGEAGFDNNPLVIDDDPTYPNKILYTGGRDGYFYAIDATNGSLLWKYYDAGSTISYSPAYNNGVVYFATQNNYAYALDVTDPTNAGKNRLIWKNTSLPGAGFTSFWPVIYQNYVVFAGSNHYTLGGVLKSDGATKYPPAGNFGISRFDRAYAWPLSQRSDNLPLGAYVDYIPGDNTTTDGLDATYTRSYLTNNPNRNTVHILNQSDGQRAYTAPFLWQGNHSTETRYPVVINQNRIYAYAGTLWDVSIAWARIVGWEPSKPNFLHYPSRIAGNPWQGVGQAVDKPGAISGSGNYVYAMEQRGKDVEGAYIGPNPSTSNFTGTIIIPTPPSSYQRFRYHNANIDDTTGVTNGPIPFQGKLYFQAQNVIYAYGE